MRIIAISSPKAVNDEAFLIKALLKNGVDIVHLRKPQSEFCDSEVRLGSFYSGTNAIGYIRALLKDLSAEERSKIIVHDYYELYEEFSLKGIHINKNIKTLPKDYKGFKTRSCHAIEEVLKYKEEFDYLFLSPVFDSISKGGYKSTFSSEQLLEASKAGVIDDKVVALGGVTINKIPFLKSLNFGGVAMLGAIYKMEALNDLKEIELYK